MSAAVDRHAAILARDGWCVFGRATEPDLLAGIEADLDARFAATPLCQGAFYGERTKRFGSLLTRAHGIERLVMHPLVLEIAEQMLLPWCERIALNLTQAIEIHPGALPQLPHRDQDMWQGPTRLDVIDGTTLSGPVTLRFDLAHDCQLDDRLTVIRTFIRASVSGRTYPQLARRVQALHAMDARDAGASLREIADEVLGSGDWPGDGEHRKSLVRRMIAAGDQMVRAGPQAVLNG